MSRQRMVAPSKSNKYYKHTSRGGLNECIRVYDPSVLPNCVGYAWGRVYEVSGERPKLSRRNAELWYGYTADGYPRGRIPKVGAIACWSKGEVGKTSDGAGHVAYVEQVNRDGSFITSNSGYKTKTFWRQKIPANGHMRGYHFQGFIYPPSVSEAPDKVGPYKEGRTYKITADIGLKVRRGPSTHHPQKEVSELTKDGVKHAYNGRKAVLKKGTKVTALLIIEQGDEIWFKIPSGYICARQGDNVYVR